VLTTCVTAPFWTSWAPSRPDFPKDGVFLPAAFSNPSAPLQNDGILNSLEMNTAEEETGALQAKDIYAKVDLVREGTKFNLYIRPPASEAPTDYHNDKQFWARIKCPNFFGRHPNKACFYSAEGFKNVKIELSVAGAVSAKGGNSKHECTAYEIKADTHRELISIDGEKGMDISIPSASSELKLVKLTAERLGNQKRSKKLNMLALSVAMMNHALHHWLQ